MHTNGYTVRVQLCLLQFFKKETFFYQVSAESFGSAHFFGRESGFEEKQIPLPLNLYPMALLEFSKRQYFDSKNTVKDS